jgi:hypothetical protein
MPSSINLFGESRHHYFRQLKLETVNDAGWRMMIRHHTHYGTGLLTCDSRLTDSTDSTLSKTVCTSKSNLGSLPRHQNLEERIECRRKCFSDPTRNFRTTVASAVATIRPSNRLCQFLMSARSVVYPVRPC